MPRLGIKGAVKKSKKGSSSAMQGVTKTPRLSTSARILNPVSQSTNMKLGEKKTLDLTKATYTLNSTFLYTLINIIQTGSGAFNRVGRKVNLENLYINGFIDQVRTTTVGDYARIMVIYDRQPTGTLPANTGADNLQDTGATGTTFTNAMSGLNLNNKERFVVVMDERIQLPSATVTAGVLTNIGLTEQAGGHNPIILKRFLNLQGLNTEYKSTANPITIADIATGALYLVTAALPAAASEGWQFTGNVRLNYRDL